MRNTILAVLMAVILAGCTTYQAPETPVEKKTFEFEKEFTVKSFGIYTSSDKAVQLQIGKIQCSGSTQDCAGNSISNVSMRVVAGQQTESMVFTGSANSRDFLNYTVTIVSIKENSQQATVKVSRRNIQPIQKLFDIGKPFMISEGDVFAGNQNEPVIKASSFTDSRCAAGVQCVWEGELGVNLAVFGKDEFGQQWNENIYLGARRSTAKTFLNYQIELVNITENSATLLVTKTQAKGKMWFSYDPKQCNTNPWDEVQTPVACSGFCYERSQIHQYFENNEIAAYQIKSKQISEVVCLACTCPRGDVIAVQVDARNASKMASLGWKSMEPVFCTEDAKICPDGSGVGREAPFCEFAPCPEKQACTKELKICPDGTGVGRTEPNCEFAACPDLDLSNANIKIVKTDVPGFMINPQTRIITIDNNGQYSIETRDINSDDFTEKISTATGKITRAQLEGIAKVALSGYFFDITEEDARACIADAPTKRLEITIDKRSNTVSEIGSECEKENVIAAYDLIEKIENLIK